MSDPLALFAVTAPGLEGICARELAALGTRGRAEPGGVAFDGTLADLYSANLWLRTASRVVVRAAEFRARTFFELERHARKVPWERFLTPGRPVRLRITSKKSRLYHEGAIAERLLRDIAQRTGAAAAAGDAGEMDDEGEDAQLFIVRVVRDDFTISADSSGRLLHRRGYRQAVAKAPLRETLAAAMLLGCDWDGSRPLVDPMCGSGTIPIEAALIARNVAPGLASSSRIPRAFAFTTWPGFDRERWEAMVSDAAVAIRSATPVTIIGSDRDAGAIEAARANAGRAGVGDDVAVALRPVSAMEPPPGPGLIISNPPYGTRVGDSDPLRDLYAALGKTARAKAPGWRLALLSADRKLEGQVGIRFDEVLRTSNGGIPVRLVVGSVGG